MDPLQALRREEFLSEEDLDLASLSQEELIAYWNLWLVQAQISNEDDEDEYSHGVFVSAREAERLIRLCPTPEMGSGPVGARQAAALPVAPNSDPEPLA